MNFSKSKYVSFWQCPKIIWLDKYKPTEKNIDDGAVKRMATGSMAGDLARSLFGKYSLVTETNENGKLDLEKMINKTAASISDGIENICEAAFSYNGLYCAVDILHKENGGYGNFDNEMCKILSKLKTNFSNIKIIFVTPYLSPSYSKLKYADKYFDEIIYPPIESAPKKLAIIKRNEWMVDNCDLLIAHISHSWGGANKTLEYAIKRRKHYINFAYYQAKF